MGYRPGRKLRAPWRDRVSTPVSSWLNFTPARFQSLALWLDASDSTTITESGGAISQWNDKSGNGNNAVQSTGIQQPAYISAGQNGLNVVRYDGSNDSMTISNFSMSGTFTIFVAAKFTQNGLVYEQSVNSNSNSGLYLYTTIAAASNINRSGVRSNVDVSVNWLSTSSWLTATQHFNGLHNSLVLWRNNIRQTFGAVSISDNPGNATVTDNLFLGSRAGTSFFIRGDYGEVIIYNTYLNFSQVNDVNTYLARKWGTP